MIRRLKNWEFIPVRAWVWIRSFKKITFRRRVRNVWNSFIHESVELSSWVWSLISVPIIIMKYNVNFFLQAHPKFINYTVSTSTLYYMTCIWAISYRIKYSSTNDLENTKQMQKKQKLMFRISIIRLYSAANFSTVKYNDEQKKVSSLINIIIYFEFQQFS